MRLLFAPRFIPLPCSSPSRTRRGIILHICRVVRRAIVLPVRRGIVLPVRRGIILPVRRVPVAPSCTIRRASSPSVVGWVPSSPSVVGQAPLSSSVVVFCRRLLSSSSAVGRAPLCRPQHHAFSSDIFVLMLFSVLPLSCENRRGKGRR